MKHAGDVDTTHEEVTAILRALKKIEYGSVEITIHGSKIVQIETREKVRLPNKISTK